MSPGELYLVSTPIGNLKDITLRALEILKEVDLILAEDTRTAKKLLAHFDIKGKKLLSFHSHNLLQRIPTVIKLLKEGKRIALVSEAGTPAISDPGYLLVQEAIKEGIKITPIPGPSAFLSALIISGLPTRHFYFGGFLPSTGKMRRRRLREVKDYPCTLIFYESPHRILKSLEDIKNILGNREIALVRELTKIYEEVIRGSVEEVEKILKANPEKMRGEMVLIISSQSDKEGDKGQI